MNSGPPKYLKRVSRSFYLLLLAAIVVCCTQKSREASVQEELWLQLWNGTDFTGWHTYLGTPFQQDKDSLGHVIAPFGVDNDPLQVISIVEQDGASAIRISGVAWGMMYSEKQYQNYHLKLKMKWGADKHPPRKDQPRDSGILYHGFGVPGSVYNWMSSQELQVQQGDMGDYWPVGDVRISIPSKLHDSLYYVYDQQADLRDYYFADILNVHQHDSMAKRRVLKNPDAELPHGAWNQLELITFGDSSIHIVNGVVVMRLYNSRTMEEELPLKSGRIMLQSEGAEVFYKDLELQRIEAIPDKFKES